MPRGKKFEERKAEEYLKSIGYRTPIFEPNRNSPPDFLIENNIAVEVRRLNQYVDSNGKLEPIELLDFKIVPRINKILESLNNDHHTNSANITLEFSRPLKVTKELENNIKSVLTKHIQIIDKEARYNFDNNLSLEIAPLSYRKEKPYVLLSIDEDTGGLILNNLLVGLNYAINEKNTKILPYYSNYKTWWLLLVDFISPLVDKITYDQIRAEQIDKKLFNKIIVISPEQYTRAEILE